MPHILGNIIDWLSLPFLPLDSFTNLSLKLLLVCLSTRLSQATKSSDTFPVSILFLFCHYFHAVYCTVGRQWDDARDGFDDGVAPTFFFSTPINRLTAYCCHFLFTCIRVCGYERNSWGMDWQWWTCYGCYALSGWYGYARRVGRDYVSHIFVVAPVINLWF